MRRQYVFIVLFLLVVSSLRSSGQDVIYPFEDIQNEEFNFTMTLSADYANHIEDSILITVQGNRDQSFSITQTGPNSTEGVWIAGIEQESIENKVSIGKLFNSGFNASSTAEPSASVHPFNYTLPAPNDYNTTIALDIVPFLFDDISNVTVGGNFSTLTPFIQIEPVFFLVNIEAYMEQLANNTRQYLTFVSANLGIDTDITQNENSLSYSISGVMPDIHRFTYYEDHNITSLDQLHEIEVEGGINLEFGDDKVLDDFVINYIISYADVRIMEYTQSVSVRTGTGGNRNIGDAGVAPGFDFGLTLLILTVIPMVKMLQRKTRIE